MAAAPLAVDDVNGTPWGWRVERRSPPGAPPPLLQGIGRVTGDGPRPGTGVDATATRRPACGTARPPARRIAAEGEKSRMNGFAPRRAALSHTRPGPSNSREHWDESSRCQALSKFHRRQWITASKLGKPARNPDCATVGKPLAETTVARPFLVVSLPSPEAYGAWSHTERLLTVPATGCPWRLTHSAGQGVHRGRIDVEALDTQVEMSSLLPVRGVQREVS
jgi:hypothetical protein